MNSLGNPKQISFLATWPTVDWIVQDVGVPIIVNKGSRILIHDTSFSESSCLFVDKEIALLLDQSGMPFQVPQSQHLACKPPFYEPNSAPALLQTAPPKNVFEYSASSMGADSAPLCFPRVPRTIRPLPFPRTHVSEMVKGLKDTMLLKGEDQLAAAFKRAFPDCAYGQTSLKTARNLLWRALEIGGNKLVEDYIRQGQTEKGLWKTFKDDVNGKPCILLTSIVIYLFQSALNPSKGVKLFITPEMKAALASLDTEAGLHPNSTSSPSNSSMSTSSPQTSSTQQSPPAPHRPTSPSGSSSSDEEPEEGEYDVLSKVSFEEYQLVDGEITSVLGPLEHRRTYEGLLGMQSIAKGSVKEVYMVRIYG
jgi:hypothetical protein